MLESPEAVPVILDGGLSTQLSRRGFDVAGPLWTARALLDQPSAIEEAHRDFIEAGADVVITASYQVSRQGFRAAGRDADEADQAIAVATATARRAAGASGTVVAASVGPYGAILHDGSEYRGNYGLSVDELAAFHAERLAVITATEPDWLAVESIPDVIEVRALCEALASVDDLPAWMTFTCIDDMHLCSGQVIEEACQIAMSSKAVRAIGVNCTDPRFVAGLVARIRAVTTLPVIVYPNAGGQWVADEWHGSESGVFDSAQRWRDLGANAIGGCCGTDADDIRALRAMVS